jgi:hypothetical protein
VVQSDALVRPGERGGQPPGAPAEQSQGGGEEQAADECRVGEDGDRGADPQDLEDDDVGGAKDADRDREEERGRGDDAPDGADAAPIASRSVLSFSRASPMRLSRKTP